MSAIGELSGADLEFLRTYLPHASSHAARSRSSENADSPDSSEGQPSDRPLVTLTYACSLDSMISLSPGVRTALSGPATKSMTHYLRLQHDAILIGVATAVADDPSLNCRYPGATLDTQPRPVVLDPTGRFHLQDSQLIQLSKTSQGKQPWLIRRDTRRKDQILLVGDDEPLTKPTSEHSKSSGISSRLEWSSILQALKLKGIRSVMIEGGATIINDLLSRPNLVDSVIITIAPTWLGNGGVTVSPAGRKNEDGQRINAAYLENATWRQFGQDVVLCGKPKR